MTSAGAATATGRTAIALRTGSTEPTSGFQVTAPNTHWPRGASVRVNSTLNCAVLPAGTLRRLGVTLTLKPAGASTWGTNCSRWLVTLVTRRVTTCEPASSPTPIVG